MPSPLGEESTEGHPGGLNNHFPEQKSKETKSGLNSCLPQEGNPQCSENQEDFRIVESLEFIYELCTTEDNLLKLLNKLNDSHYMNSIVNLSS